MSASLASAMMNARERGLALISASLTSSDFMGEFRDPIVEGRKESEFRSPNLRARPEVSLQISGFGFLSDFGFRISHHTFTFASVSFSALAEFWRPVTS